jgi:hypothetical protein
LCSHEKRSPDPSTRSNAGGVFDQKKMILQKLKTAKMTEESYYQQYEGTASRGIFNYKNARLKKKNSEDFSAAVEHTPENECTTWAGLTTFCVFGGK